MLAGFTKVGISTFHWDMAPYTQQLLICSSSVTSVPLESWHPKGLTLQWTGSGYGVSSWQIMGKLLRLTLCCFALFNVFVGKYFPINKFISLGHVFCIYKMSTTKQNYVENTILHRSTRFLSSQVMVSILEPQGYLTKWQNQSA